MAIYPQAKYKKITAKKRSKMMRYDRVNLHIAVSDAPSLFNFFNVGGRPDSHFYVLKNGTVEQYVDTDLQAYADLQGNPTTISVETQGGVKRGEKWTDAQINALAALFAWCSKTHSIKMELAKSSRPGENRGLSWHRLGVDGNFPAAPSILAGRLQLGGGLLYSRSRGKTCPEDARILQIPEILRKAKNEPAGSGSSGKSSSGSAGSAGSGFVPFLVRVTAKSLNIRTGPSVKEKKVGAIKDKGVYTIVDGQNGWGKLKSGAGWISLHYTELVSGSSSSSGSGKTTSGSSAGLKVGSSGAKVRALQNGLNRVFPAYSKLLVDGYYGAATAGVVKEFQRRVGLVADGWCGPITLAALKKFGITI